MTVQKLDEKYTFLDNHRQRKKLPGGIFSYDFSMITQEPGVLEDSRIYIKDPSVFAEKALIHVPFWGNYHCVDRYDIDRQYWDYLLLFRIDSGELELTYLDEQVRLTADCLYLIDCRVPQRYRAVGEVRFRWVHFRGGNSQLLYEALLGRSSLQFSLREHPDLDALLEKLFTLLSIQATEELAVNLALTHLLTDLIEVSQGKIAPDNSALQKVQQQILARYLEDIHLEDLAQSVNLSVCHLARQYRRHYGVPPHEQLLTLRIAEAKRLLLTTYRSVESIAENCGFNSTSHFIRAFGQRVGKTPGQFRRQKF